MTALPLSLQAECALRPHAPALSGVPPAAIRRADPHPAPPHRGSRFCASSSTTSSGVSDFLCAIYKVEQELKDAGEDYIPKSFVAAAILAGMGNRYPTCRDLLQALPKDQQTKEVFAQRLLESEKNETINQEINSLTLGTSSSLASVNATTRNPGHSSAGPSTLKVCGYVRKRQGRHSWNKPGQVCVKKHTGECWMKLDDQWLASNPTKTPADLPDRLQALRAEEDAAAAHHAASITFDPSGDSVPPVYS